MSNGIWKCAWALEVDFGRNMVRYGAVWCTHGAGDTFQPVLDDRILLH